MMFGKRKPYGMTDYGTPGGPLPGAGIDPAMMEIGPDPYAGERPDAKPGFFGKGRKLRDAFGYGLGALAEQLGGSNPYEAQMKDDRELQQALAVARIKADSRDNDTPAMREADSRFPRGSTDWWDYVRGARMKPSGIVMIGGEPYSQESLMGGGFGGGGGLPTVTDQASYDAVPSGGRYVDAQGNERTKR